MKRWLDCLQGLRKRDTVLSHGFDQRLSHPRRQANHLLDGIRLNQETRESWASRQIAAFFQGLNFNGQDVLRHSGDSIAEKYLKGQI